MNYSPKISIIIPIYNAEKYLCRCVDSIIVQTFTDFELNAQKRCIHRLRRQFGLDEDEYRHLVRQFSGGRTTTSAELCKSEAARLIGTLLDPDGRKDPERREKLALVKAIYAVSMDIGFLNRSYRSDNPVEVEMNKAKITSFLKSHGGCRKPVSSQNLEELKATLKQLKAIRRKEEV